MPDKMTYSLKESKLLINIPSSSTFFQKNDSLYE